MKKFVLLLALLALAAAGCATAVTNANPPVSANPQSLQWGIVGVDDVPTLDPALASDPISISVASMVYGGLVRLDAHLRVHADGAKSWTISRDGTVYTFHLRPNLRFPDGRRVTAGDFAAAIERALGPDGSAGAASFYLGSIVHRSTLVRGVARPGGIQVIGSRTLRITLTHPSAHFLAQLAFPASYVPEPSVLTRYGANWTDHAAGFGPYRVAQWSHTRYLTLVRNPYYWQGTPTFRQITLHFYGGDGNALAAYRRGTLDVIAGLPAGQSVPGRPATTVTVPGLALDYLAFNTTRVPFHRLNARRAFAAVWRPSFVRSTLGDSAFPARSLLPSAFGITTARWQATASPALYLKRARYPKGQNFPPVALVVPRDAGLDALARRLVQAWHNALGIWIIVRHLDLSVYDQVLARRTFDLALVRWGADYADPQDFLATQLGASPDNVTGWSTRAYDQAVHLADSYDPRDPRRATLFRQAVALATRKLPILPLDEPALSGVIRPGLSGITITPLGTITGDWTRARMRS